VARIRMSGLQHDSAAAPSVDYQLQMVQALLASCGCNCGLMRTFGGVAQRELTATVVSSGGPTSGGVLSGGLPSPELPVSGAISTSGLVVGTLALASAAGAASSRRSKEKPCRSVARPTKISAMRMMTCVASLAARR